MAKEDTVPTNTWLTEEQIPQTILDCLFRLNIKINGEDVHHDSRVDVNIDYDALEGALERAPAMFAYWSMILAEQKYAVGELDRQLRFLRSKIVESAKKSAKDEGLRFAKHELDDIVERNKDYRELEKRHAKADLILSKLYGILEALRMKSEHLRSLAGFKRQELRDTQGQ